MGGCISAEASRSSVLQHQTQGHAANSEPECRLLSQMQNLSGLRESSVIQRVKNVLSLLSDVPATGYLTDCNQACELLQRHLPDCATVSLYTYKCSSPSVCVLAGAAGLGSHLLQQHMVTTGSSWSASVCCMQLGASYLYRTVRTADDVRLLPQDWAALYQQEGLCSFLAMHVTVAGQDTPIGVISLASRSPTAFTDSSWNLQLGMISTGLVPMLTSPWLSGVAELASRLQEGCSNLCSSFPAFAATFLQDSKQLLQDTTHMALGVRLGLLSQDQQQVLLLHHSGGSSSSNSHGSFEQQRSLLLHGTSSDTYSSMDGCVSILAEAQPSSKLDLQAANSNLDQQQMEVARLPADQTLLLQAIQTAKPQLVANITAYLELDDESGQYPCADLVDLGSEHLASIIVVPISSPESKAVGALYVTCEKSGAFLQDSAVVAELAGLLQRLLQQDQLVEISEQWDELQVSPESSESSFVLSGPNLPSASLPMPTSSSRLAVMHRVWQKEDKHQDVCKSDSYVQELEVHSILGQGGFSTVYAGTWHGSRAAIKVMPTASTDKLGINMKAAMEMAALSTLRHPNIVRTYACLTDMVQERCAPSGTSGSNVSFRKAAHEDELAGKCTCNILVMEQCDRACLWTAVRHQQLLHKKLADGRSRINMRLLYNVLLEVAYSLKYLHSVGMVHCDLKAENVIMASTRGRSCGFTCKLADFGLVKLLDNKGLAINIDTSGTLTHLAPERFKAGAMISAAVDVFSFGVVMYELYAGQKPYAGMQPGAAMAKSIMQGMRPQFPSSTPAAYRQLAEACWAANAAERPAMEIVVVKLQEQIDAAARPARK